MTAEGWQELEDRSNDRQGETGRLQRQGERQDMEGTVKGRWGKAGRQVRIGGAAGRSEWSLGCRGSPGSRAVIRRNIVNALLWPV